MAFPRSGVELVGDVVALLLSQPGHAGSLGQVLSNEAVGIFVGATLP